MEELERMLALVRDADPQIRRYAISQLQVLADGHDEDEVMDALRGALSDPVPLVSHQANRTLAFFLNRNVLPAAPRDAGATGGVFEGVTVKSLRDAGLKLLRPLVEKLLDFAAGGDPEVAKRAIIALGKIGEPAALGPLARAIRRPPLAKVAAIALAQLDAAGVLEPLLSAAEDPEPAIRQHAVLELGRFPDTRALESLLANRAHPHPGVRANVAVALGEYPDRAAALRPLLKMLEDREIWVVLEVLLALSRFDEDAAMNALIQRFHEADDEHVKATALAALGRMGRPAALGLVEGALGQPNDRVRANAVESMVQLGASPDALAARLTPLLKDPSNRVRGNAAVALFPHASDAVLACVDAMLASDDLWFRASGAWALGRMNGTGPLTRLVRVLSEEAASEVLYQGIKALDAYRDARAVDPLVKLLEHSSAGIRSRAARLLGRLEDRALFPALSGRYFRENDSLVRSALISAIGAVVEPRNLSFVQEALERDTDPRVQANALTVLSARGGMTALPTLRPFVSSTHNRIKANAVLALVNHGEFEVVSSLLAMLDATSPRQFYSAIYVVGEIGRTLRHLRGPGADVNLMSSLRNLHLNTSGVTTRRGPVPRVSPGKTSREEHLEKLISAGLARVTPPPGGPVPSDDALAALVVHRLSGATADSNAYRHVLERLSDGEPDFLNPLVELAQLLSRGRDAPAMIATYLKAYAKRIAQLEEQMTTTRELLGAGKHAEAILCLKELAQSLPLRSDTHLRLGRMYLALKLPMRAARHLMLAHAENPSDPEIAYDYACACYQKGSPQLARVLCQEITRVAAEPAAVLAKAKRMLAAIKEQGEAE